MRPIDADALYETLCHIWDRSDSEEFEQAVFESIANAPTIDQPRGEWIPCSERLPELHREDPAVNIEPQLSLMADYYVISDPVLVMRNGPFTDKNERIMVAQYEDGLDGRVYWQTLDAESLPDVVAWMPLPEAMKEGEPNG